jgi:hydroxymethylpyrimidine kinase/phosphomethylpyrimidine kinase/thiamine-phosphate diphosphorylase
VLSIAGSDPSGGAGIQADLQTFAKLGVNGAAVITALTVQDRSAVTASNIVSPELVTSQIDAAFKDGNVDAVKTGMLGNASVVRATIDSLMRHGARNVVVDPVSRASSGATLLDEDGLSLLRRELLPNATLVTPNTTEAGLLLKQPAPKTLDEMRDAARKLCELGVRWAVVTGGHAEISHDAVDVLSNGEETFELRVPRSAGNGNHGSGCRYSAAVAAALARGADVPSACADAQRFVAEAIREASGVTPKLGRLYLVATPWATMNGFEFLARIRAAIEGGVDIVQLRSKELDGGAYVKLAERVSAIAGQAGIPFIVNDRVDVALAVGADGVHLGQKDLAPDLARRVLPGKIVGRSSHEAAHANKAIEERADYFAVGPVWETPTKPGRKAAGVKYVREVVALAPEIPWYAIGGINADNIREVIEAGAKRIAVVRAILDARDPSTAAATLKSALDGVALDSAKGVA